MFGGVETSAMMFALKRSNFFEELHILMDIIDQVGCKGDKWIKVLKFLGLMNLTRRARPMEIIKGSRLCFGDSSSDITRGRLVA